MALIVAAVTSGGALSAEPQAPTDLVEARMQKLNEFRAKPKFVPDGLYTGVPDAAQRLQFVHQMDAVASKLQPLVTASDPKPQVLQVFEASWPAFEMADTEDRERALGYFEELMSVFGIESSDGLFNRLMYGFDPTLSPDERNRQALAAMTDAERTIAEHLSTLSGQAAEAELRRRLGQPIASQNGVNVWAWGDAKQNLMSIARDGGKARLTWTFRGQLWSCELSAP